MSEVGSAVRTEITLRDSDGILKLSRDLFVHFPNSDRKHLSQPNDEKRQMVRTEFVNQSISDGVGHKILLFRREPHYHMVWSLSGDLIYSQPDSGPYFAVRPGDRSVARPPLQGVAQPVGWVAEQQEASPSVFRVV